MSPEFHRLCTSCRLYPEALLSAARAMLDRRPLVRAVLMNSSGCGGNLPRPSLACSMLNGSPSSFLGLGAWTAGIWTEGAEPPNRVPRIPFVAMELTPFFRFGSGDVGAELDLVDRRLRQGHDGVPVKAQAVEDVGAENPALAPPFDLVD